MYNLHLQVYNDEETEGIQRSGVSINKGFPLDLLRVKDLETFRNELPSIVNKLVELSV